METKPAAKRRYQNQRVPVTPPHVSIKVIRKVAGLTLEQLAGRIGEITGDVPTKGALSAIENGHRGASADLIRAIEMAYGLDPGEIATNYRPRLSSRLEDVAV